MDNDPAKFSFTKTNIWIYIISMYMVIQSVDCIYIMKMVKVICHLHVNWKGINNYSMSETSVTMPFRGKCVS